jgi:hypothetical protein
LSAARPALADEGGGEEIGVEPGTLQVGLVRGRREEMGEHGAEEVGVVEGEMGEGETGRERKTGWKEGSYHACSARSRFRMRRRGRKEEEREEGRASAD